MASKSVYRPLNSSETRLLTLLPGPFRSPLECNISHANLDEAIEYDALSYVWGPVEDEHSQLSVDGYPFTITMNLYVALQCLRRTDEPLTMWIDAICINQSDTNERSAQVRLMRNIYEGARQVVSWLGLPRLDLGLVTELLNELDRDEDGDLNASSIIQSAFDHTQLEKWRSVLQLFGFGYWKRVWIMQEVVCARKITLHCGHNALPWIDISRIALVLDNNLDLVGTIPNLRAAGLTDITTPARLRVLWWGWQNRHQGLPLLFLLQRARTHRCSDSRDKVYGLLGICDDTMDINYNLSPLETFLETVRVIISKRKILNVICESWAQEMAEDQPSWCPDWSRRNFVLSLSTNGSKYQAGSDSEAIAVFSTDGKVLTCMGGCIGTVTTMGDKYYESNYYLNPFSEVKKNLILRWLDLALQGRPQEIKKETWKENRIEAFWRTLVGGTSFENQEISPKFYRHLFDVARGAESRPKEYSNQPLNTKDAAYQRLTWRMDPPKSEDDQFQRYIAPFASKTNCLMLNRKFFTAGTTIMGVAPSAVEIGDQICVFYGCSWPVILRKSGGNHVLIGAAYVEGFMYGKAVKMMLEGLLAVEEFSLE